MQESRLDELEEKVQHGDFMLPFAQYVTWFPLSFTSWAMHWHNEMEIIYVEHGMCEINLDLERHVIKTGDIILVRPHALHSLKQHEEEHCCLFSWVFDLNMLSYGVTDACYVRYLKPFQDGGFTYPAIISPSHEMYEELQQTLLGIHKICDEKGPCLELNIRWQLGRLCYLLFLGVFQKEKVPKEQKPDAVQHIRVVLDYIQEHYQNPLTIGELANLLHFSEPYFMRFFKKHTGMTCVDYINDFRMAKATELLRSTNLSVMEIAMQVGMHNTSYFNRIFRKKFNKTPREYRKTAQEDV